MYYSTGLKPWGGVEGALSSESCLHGLVEED